jgi:CHAT domain-containing protein
MLLLNERPLSSLTKEIQNADLVHITCHGYRDPLMLRIHETNDRALNLSVDSVAGDDFRIKPRCLIYANSCSSAAGEFSREEFVGFGWEFYTKGAAAYIGTLGTVPTKEAISFARRFYSRLASGQSDNIYDAYQATREEAIAAGPACLLFCIYGNYRDEPSFKLTRREAAGGAGEGGS